MAQTAAAVGAVLLGGYRNHTNDWNSTDTGVLLTANDALEILLAGIPTPKPTYVENLGVVFGIGLQRPGITGTVGWDGMIKVNGLFACPALYRMIGNFFGSETLGIPASGSVTHMWTYAANSPYVGNFAYWDNVMSHDVPMCKVHSLEFEFETNKIPVVTIGLTGKREYVQDEKLNTLAVMSAATPTITLPTQPAIPYPIHQAGTATIRFNDVSGGLQLASTTDDKFPSKVHLKFAKKTETFFTNQNGPYADEPIYGGWFETSGSITFPYLKTATEWLKLINMTEQKMDYALTGSTIGGGIPWKWLFQFPSIIPKGDGVSKVSKPGVLGWEVQFSAHDARSNPSGMSFNRPRMTVTDTYTTATHVTNGGV